MSKPTTRKNSRYKRPTMLIRAAARSRVAEPPSRAAAAPSHAAVAPSHESPTPPHESPTPSHESPEPSLTNRTDVATHLGVMDSSLPEQPESSSESDRESTGVAVIDVTAGAADEEEDNDAIDGAVTLDGSDDSASDSDDGALGERLNAQQVVSRERVPEKIKDWPNNHDAQEAVLDSYSLFDAHIGPSGKSGTRLESAIKHLGEVWGYTINARTMSKYVTELMDRHRREEERRDGESGIEYDETDIQGRIREKLDTMLEEYRDFVAAKESSSDKRKREEDLRRGGLRHRENVARSMIGGESIEIGGPAAELRDNGTDGKSTKPPLEVPAYATQPETPTNKELLSEEKASKNTPEADRLEFEKAKFAAEVELRRAELAAHAVETQRAYELERAKFDMQREESERRREEFRMEMDLRMRTLEMQMKASNAPVFPPPRF